MERLNKHLKRTSMLTKRCANCDEVLSWKTAQLLSNHWPCQNCGKEHPLLETVVAPSDLAYKDKITKAKGVEVQQHEPLTIMVSPSAKRSGWVFLILGLFLCWFVYTILNGALLNAGKAPGIGLWFFFGALVLIGLWCLATAIKRLCVFHKISIQQGQLRVVNRLFNLIDYAEVKVLLANITQLYIAGEADYEVEASNTELSTQVSYQLLAQLQTGEDQLLISGLSNYQTGFFIERTIERALAIEEERVAGEFIPFFDLLPKVVKLGHKFRRGLRILSWLGD